jgi:hypothetical protein
MPGGQEDGSTTTRQIPSWQREVGHSGVPSGHWRQAALVGGQSASLAHFCGGGGGGGAARQQMKRA